MRSVCSELEHAGGPQAQARLAGLELVADLPFAASGLGVGVAGLIDGETAYDATLHYFERVVALVALGDGSGEFRQGNWGNFASLHHAVGHQFAIATAACPLHKHIDLWHAVAVEVGNFGAHHPAIDRLLDGLDRRLGALGDDRQLLLGAIPTALDLKAEALQLEGLVEAGASQGAAGQGCSQEQGGSGELGEEALQGKDGQDRPSGWLHGTLLSIPPVVWHASGPGAGLDCPAGKPGALRIRSWRHRLAGFRDASFGWLAALAGPGCLASEASSLAVPGWKRSARGRAGCDCGLHGLPAPVLLQCDLVPADGPTPAGGAERSAGANYCWPKHLGGPRFFQH